MNKIIISSKSNKTDYIGYPITLNKKNQSFTGIIILSLLGAYHILLTKNKRYIKIDWNENPDKINNQVFYNLHNI